MTPGERDAFLAHASTCRVATVGPQGQPDVTPLWFHWDGAALWLSSLVRSQRWTNLERDPRVAIVVDNGETFLELHGVELSGRADPVGEIRRAGEPTPELREVELAYATKYAIDPDHMYDGRHAWLRITVEHEVSWDHRKIAADTAYGRAIPS
jgi:hypothetical protein